MNPIHPSIHLTIPQCILHSAYNLSSLALHLQGEQQRGREWRRRRGNELYWVPLKCWEMCECQTHSHTHTERGRHTHAQVYICTYTYKAVAANLTQSQRSFCGSTHVFHSNAAYLRSSLTTAHEWMAHAQSQFQIQSQCRQQFQSHGHMEQ